ncbi:MAG: hypothetical protein KIT22_10890 [Verrucomicrobiae bacterium]|nr:hypothetical protein [Verrucomicrobiae bacterium]
MNTRYKVKAVALTLAALASCLAVILVFLRNDDLSGAERRNIAEDTLRTWMKCDYEPIDRESLSNVVASIEFQMGTSSDLQYAGAARESAANFLAAFSVGNVEAFKHFRFPAHAGIKKSELERIQAFRKAMREKTTEAAGVVQAIFPVPPKWAIDPKYLATHPWPPLPPIPRPPDTTDLTDDNFTEVMVRLASKDTYYKNYFEAICPKQSFLRIEHLKEPPVPIAQFIEAQGYSTLGLSVLASTPYLFEHTPETEITAGRNIVLLTFVAMIRLQAPDTYTPFFVQYYFSPPDRVFIPFQFALGNFHRCSEISFVF